MRQRIIYVWLPRIETDRIIRNDATLRDSPLAIVTDTHNGSCLHAINAQAQAAGLMPGMMISAARTICPGLTTRPLDLRADKKAITGIAKWCRAFTPIIARDGPNGLFLDITGCTPLFGGERTMLKTLTSRLTGFKLNALTALADTPGAAWALARFGQHQAIAPNSQTANAIGPLPVAGLRIDSETSDMLRRLGFKKIENLYGLERAALAARFGIELVQRLDQALGSAPEPLQFDREAKPYRAAVRFLEPISLVKDVETSLNHLLGKLCARLASNGLGVRRLMLTLTRVDNTTAHLKVGTNAPTHAPDDLARLFQDKLETLDADFGFERITLHATLVQAHDTHQIALSYNETAKADISQRAALIDRLSNRLGPGSLRAYAFAQSHMPERAYTISAPSASSTNATSKNPFPRTNVARPLRLYERPIAINLNEPGHNASKTMTVLRRTHTISQAIGPERIAQEWWHNEPSWSSDLREYWWVTDNQGQRFWIFKQHDKSGNNQWFLHGLGA